MSTIKFEGLFISGQRQPAEDGGVAEITNPANGDIIAIVAQATASDVDKAVTVAHKNYHSGKWRALNTRERGQMLQRMADAIREKADSLALIESQNAGKPLGAARGEINAAASTFEYYAGAVNKFHGQTIPVAAPGTSLTFRESIGVCALIVPWNFPMLITSWKVAPALAMGNTVVVKPAGVTPLSALWLADIAVEAGLPPGVFNVVSGSGQIAGSALTEHPQVAKISFTGSTAVGSGIMQTAGGDIKRVSLELGGKSANVVFADADLDSCVESSVFAVYDNAGQDCCSRSRILVERPIFDRFVSLFEKRVKSLVVGNPLDDSTEMGPLITRQHLESVKDYIAVGQDEGGSLLCGGDRPSSTALQKGHFLNPAIFVDVDNDMRVMQEEIFGPVVGIVPFGNEAEALQLANASPYGLSGSLWTRDIARALRFVRAWETGMISVNSSSSVHIEAPFGGMKKSGLGREQGMAALEHYSEYKSVFISHD